MSYLRRAPQKSHAEELDFISGGVYYFLLKYSSVVTFVSGNQERGRFLGDGKEKKEMYLKRKVRVSELDWCIFPLHNILFRSEMSLI